VVVAERHDLHPNLLHHWRRQAKRAMAGVERLKLLPVTVTDVIGQTPSAEGSIEIELGGTVRVQVDGGWTRRRWATTTTQARGTRLSSTIRVFSSADQRRRRSGPVNTDTVVMWPSRATHLAKLALTG
jgi:hypothetical protein